MADEIVVKVDGSDESATVVEDTASAVIDAAVVIADKIDEARQEGAADAGEVEQIKYTLDDLWSMISTLHDRVGIVTDLLMGLSDQVAALATLEVAELIETETEATVEDVIETAEEIAPVVETPVVATEPEIRKSKARKWI